MCWGSISEPVATFWEVVDGVCIFRSWKRFFYAKVNDGKCVHVLLCAFEDLSVQDPEFGCFGTRTCSPGKGRNTFGVWLKRKL